MDASTKWRLVGYFVHQWDGKRGTWIISKLYGKNARGLPYQLSLNGEKIGMPNALYKCKRLARELDEVSTFERVKPLAPGNSESGDSVQKST